MTTWNGMRNKLEKDYLAECLRGHIQYYATTYQESHDCEGRAAIRLDGKEILKGNFFNVCVNGASPRADETALERGAFDQRSFYDAFHEFDNQSIEDSLMSENLLVRIFGILDRRVGKRRLIAMKDRILEEPETFQVFYAIRARAENLL